MFAATLALVLALTTPCATEDSQNCTWDSAENGNGVGTSFITVDGTYYYETGNVTSGPLG